MMRFLTILAVLAGALLAAWLVWRAWPAPNSETPGEASIVERGTRGGANLIGIQPVLSAPDYRSAEALRDRLGAYLGQAEAAGLLSQSSVVVFPEHVGTWLVAAEAPGSVYRSATVSGAMAQLIAARPAGFISSFLSSPESDRAAAAVFRANATRMARDYQSVFGQLAAEYGVTIAAGSIVLPAPGVGAGELTVDRAGPLYNVSAVFGPDGEIHSHLVRKAYPIPSERGFTASAPADDYPVFDTPAGRLGVLICADSWHPDVYDALSRQDVELLAAPAFLQPSGVWDEPWGGYTTPWPEDVDRGDAGRLSEGEAWQTHALAGRLSDSGAHAGLTTFLRGDLWDLGSDGRAILADEAGIELGPDTDGGVISVVWLATDD